MVKKKRIEEIIRPLPKKERNRILEQQPLTKEWLEQEIAKAKQAKKVDLSFGIPWLAAYGFCLWKFGYTTPTLILFFIGVAYFCYAFFTRGSYGLNAKRSQVFEVLRSEMK